MCGEIGRSSMLGNTTVMLSDLLGRQCDEVNNVSVLTTVKYKKLKLKDIDPAQK
jgi:hypothetical protein